MQVGKNLIEQDTDGEKSVVWARWRQVLKTPDRWREPTTLGEEAESPSLRSERLRRAFTKPSKCRRVAYPQSLTQVGKIFNAYQDIYDIFKCNILSFRYVIGYSVPSPVSLLALHY